MQGKMGLRTRSCKRAPLQSLYLRAHTHRQETSSRVPIVAGSIMLETEEN